MSLLVYFVKLHLLFTNETIFSCLIMASVWVIQTHCQGLPRMNYGYLIVIVFFRPQASPVVDCAFTEYPILLTVTSSVRSTVRL